MILFLAKRTPFSKGHSLFSVKNVYECAPTKARLFCFFSFVAVAAAVVITLVTCSCRNEAAKNKIKDGFIAKKAQKGFSLVPPVKTAEIYPFSDFTYARII